VNLVDLNGCSALHLACREEKISAVNGLLASQKCDVNLRDKLGHTSLHYGVLNDNPQIVQVLLMNGAKVDVKDNMKMTPLHYSKEKKLKECTELLLKYK
jgi:ankyrin repeat protein